MIAPMVRHLTSPAFVGREEQLNALLGLARATEPAVALVRGEAGVGKTRLMTELSRRCEAEGTLFLAGSCLQFGDQVLPLAPAATILRGLAERVDAATLGRVLGPARGELSRLVPELADTPASGEPPPSARVFELFLGVLHRLVKEGRPVLVFEDLHWADDSSRDLFGFLTRLLRGSALLVGTYRSDELHRRHPLHPLLAEVRRATRPEEVTLDRLSRNEVSELIAGITERPADEQQAAEVQRRSGGNPFYAEELVAHGLPAGALPDTLRDVILGRAASLEEDAFSLLCVAAAADGIDDLAIVSSVVGIPVETAEALLPEIAASGLLVSGRTGWRFRHELAREVFEDQLLPGERTRVHARLAEQFHEHKPQQAGRISRHLWQAGDVARALEWSIRAAHAAEQIGASAAAQAGYERALDVWDQVTDAADRTGHSHADLLITTASAAARAGRYDRAVEYQRRAIGDLSGDPTAEGGVWLQLAPYLWLAGMPGVRDAMTHALELIPADPPSVERANALAWNGLVHLWEGRFSRAISAGEDTLEMLSAIGDLDVAAQRTEAWAKNVAASAMAALGDPAAPDVLRQVLGRTREVGDTDEVTRAYANLTDALNRHGRFDEAVELAAEGERVLGDLGVQHRSVVVTVNKLDALTRLGRWDEVEAEAVALLEATDSSVRAGFFLSNHAMVLLHRGRTAEAREAFRTRAPFSDSTGQELLGPLTTGLVELAAHDRSWDEARSLVERTLPALLGSSPIGAAELVSAGIAAEAERAALRAGEDNAEARTVAERWLGQLQEAARSFAGSAFSTQLDAWLTQATAEQYRLERWPAADRWTRVATTWEQLRRPYDAAYAWLRAGEAVLVETGVTDAARRGRAAEMLARTHQMADQLGAVPISEAAVTLARQGRLQLDPSPAAAPAEQERPFDLTDRELQVLELLAEGKTNGEIGAALFVSRKTASVHVSSILRKLGSSNRVEAAAVAHRSGLVHGPRATDGPSQTGRAKQA